MLLLPVSSPPPRPAEKVTVKVEAVPYVLANKSKNCDSFAPQNWGSTYMRGHKFFHKAHDVS